MVDCNEPMIGDREHLENMSSDLVPIASISTPNPQIVAASQQPSPRSPPPVLLDNFKNANIT